MAANSTRLGPGVFELGDPDADGFDASCQLANASLDWDKDEADSIRVLCGDTVGGGTTYSAKLGGTLLQDLSEAEGLVAYTWANRGETVGFKFTPNNAAKATVTGQLVIDPLSVGSTDDYGSVMTSDFDWSCVGEPVLSWPGTGGGAALPQSMQTEPDGAELAGV